MHPNFLFDLLDNYKILLAMNFSLRKLKLWLKICSSYGSKWKYRLSVDFLVFSTMSKSFLPPHKPAIYQRDQEWNPKWLLAKIKDYQRPFLQTGLSCRCSHYQQIYSIDCIIFQRDLFWNCTLQISMLQSLNH